MFQSSALTCSLELLPWPAAATVHSVALIALVVAPLSLLVPEPLDRCGSRWRQGLTGPGIAVVGFAVTLGSIAENTDEG